MGVIAIVNQKGGVGKTTTAVTLAHGFAIKGSRVLLIDLDSQGNVSDCLGLPEGGDLFHWLLPSNEPRPIEGHVIDSGRKHLDVIRSDKTTANLKMILYGDAWSVYKLHDALEENIYDVVILDCAPSVDLLQTAAVVAADFVLVPTRLDQLALKGVRDVLKTIEAVRHKTGWDVRLAGVLPTFYDRVTSESHEQLKHLASTFGRQVLPPIPVDNQCRVASRYGITLWEHEPHGRAIVGYRTGNGKCIGGYLEALNRIRDITEEGR